MPSRLRSELMVTALRRMAEAQGGFGAVLARGESDSGAMMVVVAEKGRTAAILERVLDATGDYRWHKASDQALQNEEKTNLFLARCRKADPDLWLIELDVPSAERFTAEMTDPV